MASSSFIQRAYIAFFNRPADDAGYKFWLNHLGPDQDLLDLFSQSEEYLSDYDGKSDEEIITIIYQNLFGRLPEAEGLNYWAGQMTAGWITVGNAAYEILGGAQGTDLTAVNNKATAAQAFTAALDTAPEIYAYANAGDNGVGHLAKDWLTAVTDNGKLTDALGSLDSLLAALITADTPVLLPEYNEINYGSPSDATFTLSTDSHVHDTIKWGGHLNNGKVTVVNFDATSASGQDTLDFTAYGASWLGAATLNASGYAIYGIAPDVINNWRAESSFPTSSLNADDTYITLTRVDSTTTEYKIELWTVVSNLADAYYGRMLPIGELTDTAELIGYVDLGFEIGSTVVDNIVF
ncbi:MAG: DUF4214 domain-containing protein [Betaproteobacteria bacterium]|nr:DUF4214 domain-containing protein [Betaproteobacteria bacterium]